MIEEVEAIVGSLQGVISQNGSAEEPVVMSPTSKQEGKCMKKKNIFFKAFATISTMMHTMVCFLLSMPHKGYALPFKSM